ncbi:HEAT repeat-containing protein [Toxoplasma gondii GAB2-2007-GAL-DOM2]|uniref:HEAT repeat-containing protein n=8 Tax=Toxoplasma gondii TaxID=5811 RepID=S7UI98_TOXGG|nr:HEAT repeat-containing protein [Toxoplasma gondii GT1]KAF4644687.1 HEAT repeat-containing protein [Toxoplasma gondii]KFG33249.1 HEAT repeat-containing protein [Toxoplasma gondii GAB2-2007-GAL-DOM2]RQX67867.1 HEAT repeat-containing protein [Toxoplasma gondii CAST]
MPPMPSPATLNPMGHPTATVQEALKALQSPDNAVRSASEAALGGFPLAQLLPALAQSVREDGVPSSEQHLAAILLRRCLQSRWSEVENSNPADTDALLQQTLECLLQAVLESSEGMVKKSAADAAAEVWRRKQTRSLEDAPVAIVARWLAEPELGQLETATALFRLFDRLCEDEEIAPRLTQTHGASLARKVALALQQGRGGGKESEACMTAALEALVTCVSSLPSSSTIRASLCDLAPLLLSVLFVSPSPALFVSSQQLAETFPQFFAGHHAALLELVVRVVGSHGADAGADDDVKAVALNVAVSAVTSAPKWARKNLNIVKPLLEVLADCCGRVTSDEETWSSKDREEDDDEEDRLAQEALALATRVAERLNNNAVLEMLLHICTSFLASDDWRRHLAALSLLAALLEEEHSSLSVIAHSDEVVAVCLLRLQSPHARLRWAALNCLCCLLQQEEREGSVTEREKNLLEKLLESLHNETNNRCRRKGLQAVAEFFSNFGADDDEGPAMDPEVYAQLSPYIEAALQNAVVPLCDSSDAQTQELALAVGSVLAQVSGQHFQRFFSFFMGAVRRLLSVDFPSFLKTHPHGCSLLETAVEFAGALATAVGMEVFAPDAPWLLERLVEIQNVCSEGTADASLQATAMEAVGIVAKVMGPAALPFLPAVSPIVLARVRQHVDCDFAEAIATGNEEAGASVSEEGRISKVNITDKSGRQTVISINTAAVEEKCAALRLLASLATSVGGQMPPDTAVEWAAAVTAESRGRFALIRKEALGALPAIVNCLSASDFGQFVRLSRESLALLVEAVKENSARHVSDFVLPAATQLLQNLSLEKERKEALKGLSALGERQDAGGEGATAAEAAFSLEERKAFLSQIFEAMGRFLIPILTEEFERLASKEGEDDEWENVDEDEEEATEVAAEAYDAVMQATGALFKLYGGECLASFDAHLKMPFGALLAHEQANPGGKVSALCIFADAITFGGAEAGKMYAEVILPAALLTVCPPSAALVEDDVYAVSAAAYGIGAVAMHSREAFLARREGAIEALTRALQSPVLQTDDCRSAADCAACALLKIALLYTREVGEQSATIFTELLKRWFPLKDDAQEIDASIDLLANMVAENHILLQAAAAKEECRRVLLALLAEKTKDAESSKDEDKKLVAMWKKARVQKALELIR